MFAMIALERVGTCGVSASVCYREEYANSQVQEGFLSTTTVYTCKAFTEPSAHDVELVNPTETHVTRRAEDTELFLEFVSLPSSVDHEEPGAVSRKTRRPS